MGLPDAEENCLEPLENNIPDRWVRNIDQGLVTGIVFIDVRKCF